jgi:hypothetical protein
MNDLSLKIIIIIMLAGAGLMHWVDFLLGIFYPPAL